MDYKKLPDKRAWYQEVRKEQPFCVKLWEPMYLERNTREEEDGMEC